MQLASASKALGRDGAPGRRGCWLLVPVPPCPCLPGWQPLWPSSWPYPGVPSAPALCPVQFSPSSLLGCLSVASYEVSRRFSRQLPWSEVWWLGMAGIYWHPLSSQHWLRDASQSGGPFSVWTRPDPLVPSAFLPRPFVSGDSRKGFIIHRAYFMMRRILKI